MPSGGGRAAMVGAVAAGLAAGAVLGWFGARFTTPPPPTPPAAAFRNPLADAARDEVLVWGSPDGDTQAYRVVEGDRSTVLLSVETVSRDGKGDVVQFRAARSFMANLNILEGDIPADLATASVRDLVVTGMVQEDLRVPALDRTFHCWKVSGVYRGMEPRTFWVTDELPVHGVARIDGTRGMRYEVKSFSFGAQK